MSFDACPNCRAILRSENHVCNATLDQGAAREPLDLGEPDEVPSWFQNARNALEENERLRAQLAAAQETEEEALVRVGEMIVERQELNDKLAAAEQRARSAEDLAYIGEHHFADLTWKVRAEEVARKLTTSEQARAQAERELADLKRGPYEAYQCRNHWHALKKLVLDAGDTAGGYVVLFGHRGIGDDPPCATLQVMDNFQNPHVTRWIREGSSLDEVIDAVAAIDAALASQVKEEEKRKK